LKGGAIFAFRQGISLFVACDTEAEIDCHWSKLTKGGKEVPCGWLVDKFGVSWKIVPKIPGSLLANPDQAKSRRATTATLAMKKLDMAGLKRAFEGG
jgi:predicted 3-demethylubiquinone-9 3-methyltransferase (glyoxalase superfamily)